MIRRLIVLLYLVLWIGPVVSAQSIKAFRLNDHFKTTTLFGYLHLFSDSTHRITITNLLADSTNQFVFGSVRDEILNLGNDPRSHWIKCQIRNDGTKIQDLVFGLDYFDIDSLSFYIVDSTNTILYRQDKLSRKTPIADRPIAVRYFAFPVSIKPNQSVTLYCRAFRRTSMIMLPIKLFTRKAFLDNGFSFDFLFLLGIGILLIAFLTSFSLYLATKKVVLFYYAGYAISYCIALLSLEGVWSQYTDISMLDDNTKLVMSGLSTFFQVNFTLEFLHLKERLSKRWIIGIRVIAWLSLGCGFYVLVTPFSYANALLISGMGTSVLLLVLGLIIGSWSTRTYESSLYLVGFLPFFIAIFWLTGNVLFATPRNWLFYQLAYASPFAQLVILGVGLGFKLIREQEQSFAAVSLLKQAQVEAIIQTQESERQRIAADLHDDLGGTLAIIRRRIADIRLHIHDPKAAQQLDDIEPLIQKSSVDLRRIAHNLMPPEFARTGLLHALQQLVSNQPTQPTRFSFVVTGTVYRLPLTTELHLYRIVSELVQNINKHAQANQAAVQLLYYDDQLTITVEDNGLGSRLKKTVDEHTGIGLKNSSLRAEYIGARLWREESEAGTLIVLDVPYSTSPDAGQRTNQDFTS